MRIHVAIDSMVLYSIENYRSGNQKYSIPALAAEKLLEMHRIDQIHLKVIAATASENQNSMKDLQNSLLNLGLQGLEILPVGFYLDLTYIGHGVLLGNDTIEETKDIFEILFPNEPHNYSEWRKAKNKGEDGIPIVDREYRNHWCDAQMIFAFNLYLRRISAEDIKIFVSNDKNFHRNYDALAERLEWDTNRVKIFKLQEAPDLIRELLK